MFRFPVKTPLQIKQLFPNYVWDFSSTTKTIYLTFDDGPTPEITDWTLNTLNTFNAKATFFCIGDNIKKYPDIFKRIISEKHTVGNHTYNHLKGWKTNSKSYLENVERCQHILNSIWKIQIPKHELQRTLNLFRPPYGQLTTKQSRALLNENYKIIMWDVIAYDWDNSITSKTCLKNVITTTKSGSIVVLHDSLKASQHLYYILPKLLQHFTEKGYSFKAIINQ